MAGNEIFSMNKFSLSAVFLLIVASCTDGKTTKFVIPGNKKSPEIQQDLQSYDYYSNYNNQKSSQADPVEVNSYNQKMENDKTKYFLDKKEISIPIIQDELNKENNLKKIEDYSSKSIITNNYYVQIGAFSQESVAKNVMQSLKEKNAIITNESGFYKVRISYQSYEQAQSAKMKFRADGYPDAYIVSQ
jgi:hypothetical protein